MTTLLNLISHIDDSILTPPTNSLLVIILNPINKLLISNLDNVLIIIKIVLQLTYISFSEIILSCTFFCAYLQAIMQTPMLILNTFHFERGESYED